MFDVLKVDRPLRQVHVTSMGNLCYDAQTMEPEAVDEYEHYLSQVAEELETAAARLYAEFEDYGGHS